MSLHPPPPPAADALATCFASGLDGPTGGAWAATRQHVVVWRADGTGDAATFALPMPAGGGFVCVLQEVRVCVCVCVCVCGWGRRERERGRGRPPRRWPRTNFASTRQQRPNYGAVFISTDGDLTCWPRADASSPPAVARLPLAGRVVAAAAVRASVGGVLAIVADDAGGLLRVDVGVDGGVSATEVEDGTAASVSWWSEGGADSTLSRPFRTHTLTTTLPQTGVIRRLLSTVWGSSPASTGAPTHPDPTPAASLALIADARGGARAVALRSATAEGVDLPARGGATIKWRRAVLASDVCDGGAVPAGAALCDVVSSTTPSRVSILAAARPDRAVIVTLDAVSGTCEGVTSVPTGAMPTHSLPPRLASARAGDGGVVWVPGGPATAYDGAGGVAALPLPGGCGGAAALGDGSVAAVAAGTGGGRHSAAGCRGRGRGSGSGSRLA